MVLLGDTFASTDPLRHGPSIEIRANHQTATFSLAGSSRALDSLLDCANRNLAFAEAKSPSSSLGAPAAVDQAATEADAQNAPEGSAESSTDSASLDDDDRDGAAVAGLQKVEERPVGRWVLVAVVGNDTDYAMCLLTSRNELGEHLNIGLERPKHLWTMAFAGRDVRLRQNVAGDYELSYAIDDNDPKRAQAFASASGRVFVQVGRDVSLMAPVRRGSRIAFETAEGTHAFSLSGSSAALDALADCARRRLGYEDVDF
jgi:hypothetical protein